MQSTSSGGHEDAIDYNPEQHVLPNATYANSADELVTVIRQQFKEGADFIKIYETGHDSVVDGRLHTVYQYQRVRACGRRQRSCAHSANASRCTPRASPVLFMRRKLESSRSTTPTSSATKPCG